MCRTAQGADGNELRKEDGEFRIKLVTLRGAERFKALHSIEATGTSYTDCIIIVWHKLN